MDLALYVLLIFGLWVVYLSSFSFASQEWVYLLPDSMDWCVRMCIILVFIYDQFRRGLSLAPSWRLSHTVFEKSLQQVYVDVSVFLSVYKTIALWEALKNAPPKKSSLSLCFWLPPLFSSQRVFSCRQCSSCTEHLVVTFKEHSGRLEESDRVTVGTPEMSAPQAARQGGIEWQAC